MRILVDANILVSVLNKEYPLFTYSSRILGLAGTPGYEVYTSPICLAIAFYFAEKKSGRKFALQKIKTLCQHISIAEVTAQTVLQSLRNPAVRDFEDGLEYYAALESKCSCIVTEDTADFSFSTIELSDCKRFFKKYIADARQ